MLVQSRRRPIFCIPGKSSILFSKHSSQVICCVVRTCFFDAKTANVKMCDVVRWFKYKWLCRSGYVTNAEVLLIFPQKSRASECNYTEFHFISCHCAFLCVQSTTATELHTFVHSCVLSSRMSMGWGSCSTGIFQLQFVGWRLVVVWNLHELLVRTAYSTFLIVAMFLWVHIMWNWQLHIMLTSNKINNLVYNLIR